MKLLSGITLIFLITAFLFPAVSFAHQEGYPPYIKIGDKYTLHNPNAYDPSAKIKTAEDIAAEVYKPNEKLRFEFDYEAAGVPVEQRDSVIVKWSLSNGKNFDENTVDFIGNPYEHSFNKEGSYILKLFIGKKESANVEPVQLDSAIIDVSSSQIEDKKINISVQKSSDGNTFTLKDSSEGNLNATMWAVGSSKLIETKEAEFNKSDVNGGNTFLLYRNVDEHNIVRDYLLQATNENEDVTFHPVYADSVTVSLNNSEKKETSSTLLIPGITVFSGIIIITIILGRKKNGRKSHK